jgi:beta,beta-carotene 9',10'-dioxygenase
MNVITTPKPAMQPQGTTTAMQGPGKKAGVLKETMVDNYFASQNSETELTKLNVDGSLPTWLSGKLVRNGPAVFEAGKTKLRHWFDGYGMLHGFLIADGTIYYQSKFIKSEEYLNARESGKVQNTITWGTASDPCRSIFRRFFGTFTAASSNSPCR